MLSKIHRYALSSSSWLRMWLASKMRARRSKFGGAKCCWWGSKYRRRVLCELQGSVCRNNACTKHLWAHWSLLNMWVHPLILLAYWVQVEACVMHVWLVTAIRRVTRHYRSQSISKMLHLSLISLCVYKRRLSCTVLVHRHAHIHWVLLDIGLRHLMRINLTWSYSLKVKERLIQGSICNRDVFRWRFIDVCFINYFVDLVGTAQFIFEIIKSHRRLLSVLEVS